MLRNNATYAILYVAYIRNKNYSKDNFVSLEDKQMAMEYIDTGAMLDVIGALLDDKNITRHDLKLAYFLYLEKPRRDVIEWFGGSKNRAEAGRALKRLSPYLRVAKDAEGGLYYSLRRTLQEPQEPERTKKTFKKRGF